MSQSVTAKARITEIVKEMNKSNGRPYQVCYAQITSEKGRGTKVLATRTTGTNPLTGKDSSPVKMGDNVILHGRVYNGSLRFDVQKEQVELANTSDALFAAFGLKKTTASVGAEAAAEEVK